MRFFLTVSLLTILCYSGHSQILKVHKGNIDTDSAQYFMGNVALNFNLNNKSGSAEDNVQYRGLFASSDLIYVAEKHAYILITDIDYIKSTGGPLISNGYAHLRANLLRKKKLSYEIFGQVQYDNGRNLSLRTLAGAGIRLRLISKEKNRLHYGLGVMYEQEEWRPFDGSAQIKKDIPKVSTYLGGKVALSETVDLQIISFYQTGYDTESQLVRNRINGDFQLSMDVIGKLDFIVNFRIQYEDKPIIPINRYVYSLSNGLKLTF